MKKYQYHEAIKHLEIDPQFIEEGLKYAEKEGCSSIRIIGLNYNSWQKYDLDFSVFSNKSFIKELDISDSFKVGKIHHIEKLYALSNLRFLSFHDLKFDIDFSKLTQLDKLYFTYNKKLKNISALKNLKHILIRSFNQEDLQILSGLENLEILRLYPGTFLSTFGIENLKKIRWIDISHNRKIQDISNINKLPNLEKLHIERCKSLTDFSFLKDNTTLKEIFIDRLDSVDFVPYMKNLKSFKFWECKDGNLNPLLKTKGVDIHFYPNKRHYSHTLDEVKEVTK